ncbi:metallophosphoesterase family protein [Fusibacter ferrireducens]|uniref:Metallophosphoesterase n=1 Tax=Fusibacter ferrireducens TaxID=2785058 RepID=A0ABR9ZTL7_9FIRM|nr:metallophosphoesterase [Fusibacter ferrireducens]MBF4693809.1 metallophosphoesterase [Fusibacter ferrireducens]
MSERLINITLGECERIIVISDIHGGLVHLDALLDQIKLQDEDLLIILGDFIEKGPQNIEMLYRAMLLQRRPNTFILSGNCESFVHQMITNPERQSMIQTYLDKVNYPSLISDLYDKACCIDIRTESFDPNEVQSVLQEHYASELDFLEALPWGLCAPPFIFVHAGIESESSIDKKTLLSYPAFYESEHRLDKIVVVGHWPVLNYLDQRLLANPILDFEKQILNIDGGYSVKWHGQVNALVIEKRGDAYEYKTFFSDDLEEIRVKQCSLTSIEPHLMAGKPFKIMWNDNAIEVIEALPEFSLCLKKSTGEIGFVKNEFIQKIEDKTYCTEDYIFKLHYLEAGDCVRFIGNYGNYAFIKYNHEYGWIPSACLEKVRANRGGN